MIFKENTSSTSELILPPITSQKLEIPVQTNSQEEIKQDINTEQIKESIDNSEQKKSQESESPTPNISLNAQKSNLTMDVNKKENNRYNLKENVETIPEEDSKLVIIETSRKTQEKAKTFDEIKSLTNNNNPYIAKVILENVRSLKDCIYLLDNYLKSNNIQTYYEANSVQDKLVFMFADEKIAFEFSKIIYNEKNKNYLYKNVKVHFSLEPNQTFLKKQKIKNRKRGLPYESIMQLYRGSSYVKKVKEFPKIQGNINLVNLGIKSIKSPFYSVNLKKKINLFNKSRHIKFSRNEAHNSIDAYIGYDGNPLKSYEKQKISVLDTHYNPFSNIKYRAENKNKWMSPNNFKFY